MRVGLERKDRMSWELAWSSLVAPLLLAAIVLASAIRIFGEYQRGVVFTLPLDLLTPFAEKLK